MSTIEILEKCTVDGNVVKLPNIQLERSSYMEVKKKLEGIGGKWKGGKTSGFVFPSCPKQLLNNIQGGEKINLKKDFQFFDTPDYLCDKLVELAGIEENHLVLEPSAGQGAIVKAIHRAHNRMKVFCYELMDQNTIELLKIGTGSLTVLGNDFLKNQNEYLFDRIVANPPFTKNQDIDHVMHMYKHLNKGGRLVSIMGKGWTFREGNKEKEFRSFLEQKSAIVEDIQKGAFKSSGTMVETVIVIIDKN
jgi:hypothetical protein